MANIKLRAKHKTTGITFKLVGLSNYECRILAFGIPEIARASSIYKEHLYDLILKALMTALCTVTNVNKS